MKKFVLSIIAGVLTILCGIAALAIFYMTAAGRSVSIQYNCYEVCSRNKRYEGRITEEGVKIKGKDGRGKSEISVDTLSMRPDEILLGTKYYYLVQYDEDEATMLQLDYDSNIRGKKKIKGLLRAFCIDRFIFLLIDEKSENLSGFQNGRYANCFFEDGRLEGDIRKIKDENMDDCLKEEKLYHHNSGLYSTVPDLGVTDEELFFYNKVSDIKENQNSNSKKWDILNQLIKKMQVGSDDVIYVKCFQNGENLYGVCNVLSGKYVDEQIRTKDIRSAYYFVFNPKNGNCQIEYSDSDQCGIMFTASKIYYEQEGVLYEYSIPEKTEKALYSAGKSDDMNIEISSNAMELYLSDSWSTTRYVLLER